MPFLFRPARKALTRLMKFANQPSGEINVEMESNKWNGQNVSPNNRVVISGKPDKNHHNNNVYVGIL